MAQITLLERQERELLLHAQQAHLIELFMVRFAEMASQITYVTG